MAASFRLSLSIGVIMLSCTEMSNVATCISYTVSLVEILALLCRNARDGNDVSDKHIIAYRILREGDFFPQHVSSDLGNYILKQMMFFEAV